MHFKCSCFSPDSMNVLGIFKMKSFFDIINNRKILGRGQNLWGTRAGSWSRGARTFFGKKYDGLGLFFLENKGGLYFFCEKIWRARTFFLEKIWGLWLFFEKSSGNGVFLKKRGRATTFFLKIYDGLGLFSLKKTGGQDFFYVKIWRAKTFFHNKKGGPGLFFEAIFSQNPARVPHKFCPVPYQIWIHNPSCSLPLAKVSPLRYYSGS